MFSLLASQQSLHWMYTAQVCKVSDVRSRPLAVDSNDLGEQGKPVWCCCPCRVLYLPSAVYIGQLVTPN